MTEEQKLLIKKLRYEGIGYKAWIEQRCCKEFLQEKWNGWLRQTN